MHDQAEANLYREPWPPFARDPFQGPAQPAAPVPSWDGPRHSQARPAWRRWLPWLALVVLVAGIAAVVLLAVQGGNAGPSRATAQNVRACQDYRVQGVRAKAHPVLADVPKWAAWVAADAAEASPGTQLRRDLTSWASDPVSAHGRILADCAAVGVKAG